MNIIAWAGRRPRTATRFHCRNRPVLQPALFFIYVITTTQMETRRFSMSAGCLSPSRLLSFAFCGSRVAGRKARE